MGQDGPWADERQYFNNLDMRMSNQGRATLETNTRTHTHSALNALALGFVLLPPSSDFKTRARK